MVDTGMIGDYTYLWWDVRPHPRLGTVEIRAMDSQTRVEHTVALAAPCVAVGCAGAAGTVAGTVTVPRLRSTATPRLR